MPTATAQRLQKLPPYIFVQLDQMKKKAIAAGADIISFGIGDPDLPTPRPIVNALGRAARDPKNHQYPDGEGLLELRRSLADYYRRRFGVALDPAEEITTLVGSKEGVANVAGALVNPGETVAFPDPGYPVYHSGTLFAGAKDYRLFLNEDNAFLPDLEKISPSVLSRWRMLWVCYPHSPSGAVAPREYMKKVLWLANKHDFYICSDAAYVDIYYDGLKPPSFLELHGAKKRVLEFYSCSKSFNMTGWRLAFAAGNREMVLGLRKYKNNVDSGQFNAVQYAGIAAFAQAEKFIAANNRVYQKRRDLFVKGLRRLGWDPPNPPATFYVWVKTRGGMESMKFSTTLLDRCALVCTPGVGLGTRSDDHARFTLTVTEARIKEALARIEQAGI